MKHISELPPNERRQLCKFNFSDGPVEDPEGVEEAFLAFGHVAMAWGRLETHLDALLIHLNKPQFSAKLFDPDHPVSFSRKLKLLKVWFGRHKALSENKNAIDKLIPQFKTLSETRNAHIHSLFAAYDVEKQEITIRSIKYAGMSEFHIMKRDFGIEKLIRLTVAINRANRSLAVITSTIFTYDAVERLGRP